jgi:hypothetical protein
MEYIAAKHNEFNDVQQILQQTEEYYDSMGLALSMAVLTSNIIVLSSKHWIKNCYIEVQIQPQSDDKFVYGLWDIIVQTARNINRELDRASNENKYVYISNLNREQTTKVYNTIIKELEDRKQNFDIVEQYNFFGWNVTDLNCVKIPWIVDTCL